MMVHVTTNGTTASAADGCVRAVMRFECVNGAFDIRFEGDVWKGLKYYHEILKWPDGFFHDTETDEYFDETTTKGRFYKAKMIAHGNR